MTRGSGSSDAALTRRRTIRGSISVRAEVYERIRDEARARGLTIEALAEEILSETRKPFVPYQEPGT